MEPLPAEPNSRSVPLLVIVAIALLAGLGMVFMWPH